MTVREFKPEDLDALDGRLQPAQAHLQARMKEPDYAGSIQKGEAFTVEHGGVVVACAGVIELWPNRGLAWSLIARDAGAAFPAFTKAVARHLAGTRFHRVECYVDWAFTAGHRWARMLGFNFEGKLIGFSPAKTDMAMYARVK